MESATLKPAFLLHLAGLENQPGMHRLVTTTHFPHGLAAETTKRINRLWNATVLYILYIIPFTNLRC